MPDQRNQLKPSSIGGQAVLEGIMMRCGDRYSVAVRKPDQEIALDIQNIYTKDGILKKLRKIPLVRGVFAFVDSMVLGIKTITFSASFLDEEEEEPAAEQGTESEGMPPGETGKTASPKAAEDSGKWDSLLMAGTILFSVVLAVGLFMILPYFIADFLLHQKMGLVSKTMVPAVEAVVKIFLFVLYIWAVSLMKDIKRTYMYHGAEHKCINCLESGHTLTVGHVRESSRYHKRCGTSFLFLVMIISIAFFMVIRSDHVWLQYLLRILLVPLIAGVSYELIRFAGVHDNVLVRLISAPGKALQRITTSEPDDSMIEVAIAAVEAVYDWREYLQENGIKVEAAHEVL